MEETLLALEEARSELLRKFSQLGDLRPGSVLEFMARCSKPNCHCARLHDPGHGPHFRFTRKVKGKTVSKTLSDPVELRKVQAEVDEYHRMRQLSQELVEVNEKICALRPLADTLTPEEKKRLRRSSKKSQVR
jgi:hypothetical protein